ncbi:MAG: hypothetical protein M3Y81_08650 [Chloroflexota bacterium]|nr:hypothetical protein [Chloroflexota bacterium]
MNVEVIRPTMLTDRVYRVRYRGQQHILHLELETGSQVQMPARLLFYHAGILDRYDLPVISMVIYPFQVSMAESPLRETSGPEEILIFHFKTLPLCKLSDIQFVDAHATSMYALLPAMGHASDEILLQAIQEMVELYRPNQAKLSRLFVWFGVLLRRSGTLSAEEKRKVEERLQMYDNLLDEDPYLQKHAQKMAQRMAQGIAQNKFRETILGLVQERFPALHDEVEQKIAAIDETNALQNIILALALATDEVSARRYVTALVLILASETTAGARAQACIRAPMRNGVIFRVRAPLRLPFGSPCPPTRPAPPPMANSVS